MKWLRLALILVAVAFSVTFSVQPTHAEGVPSPIMAFSDGGELLWSLNLEDVYTFLAVVQDHGVVFTPDYQRVVFSEWDGQIRAELSRTSGSVRDTRVHGDGLVVHWATWDGSRTGSTVCGYDLNFGETWCRGLDSLDEDGDATFAAIGSQGQNVFLDSARYGLFSLNAQGNLDWSTTIPGPYPLGWGSRLVLDANDNILTFGGFSESGEKAREVRALTKLSPAGHVLWSLHNDNDPASDQRWPSTRGEYLTVDGAGAVVIAGVEDNGSVSLIKIDRTGQELWRTAVDISTEGWSNHLVATPSNDLILATPHVVGGDTIALSIVKLDADGDELWRTHLEPETAWCENSDFTKANVTGLAVSAQGDIYLAGSVQRDFDDNDGREPCPYVFSTSRLSADGQLLWTMNCEPPLPERSVKEDTGEKPALVVAAHQQIALVDSWHYDPYDETDDEDDDDDDDNDDDDNDASDDDDDSSDEASAKSDDNDDSGCGC